MSPDIEGCRGRRRDDPAPDASPLSAPAWQRERIRLERRAGLSDHILGYTEALERAETGSTIDAATA